MINHIDRKELGATKGRNQGKSFSSSSSSSFSELQAKSWRRTTTRRRRTTLAEKYNIEQKLAEIAKNSNHIFIVLLRGLGDLFVQKYAWIYYPWYPRYPR